MIDIEVIGLGALNFDHIYKVERILDDGEAVIDEVRSFPGGSAANTIYGLARLGVNCGFAGAVGDDAEGKAMLKNFQKAGVDTNHIRAKQGAKTGSVICLSDRAGRRSLYVIPGANNLLTAGDLDVNYLNQVKVLHLSSFVDDDQFKMQLELTGRLDPSVKLSFAPGSLYASRGIKALAPLLKRTHVLFLNQEELRQLTGKDLADGAETCLEQGCQIIVVTLGSGRTLDIGNKEAVAYIRDGNGEYMMEAPLGDSADSVDTTGAGDAFNVGFLYGLLREKGPEECGRLGDIVARFCISKVGARTGLPSADQLSRRYRELYG